MSSWHTYPHIFNLGHKAITDLLMDPVLVQEKVDGSQFSFGMIGGKLLCRSKAANIDLDNPPTMFTQAVHAVKAVADQLHPEWTYRGEYLSKPKHNVLSYDRVPQNNVILFDINTEEETYLDREHLEIEAHRLGFECVATLFEGTPESVQELVKELLTKISALGGQKIEGVVIKNYHRFGIDKNVLMGKYVSEEFKEIHKIEWKSQSGGILLDLIKKYKTVARWNKAVQHLREAGKITDSPKDIGEIMKEVNLDTLAECRDEIKEMLFRHFWKDLSRGLTHGIPEWYKNLLLEQQGNAQLAVGSVEHPVQPQSDGQIYVEVPLG